MNRAKDMKELAKKVIEDSKCDDIVNYVDEEIKKTALKGKFSATIDFAYPRRNNNGRVVCSHELDLDIDKTINVVKSNGYDVLGTKGLYTYEIYW